ncbi:fumarylacetoacetate hydrolase family protein [Nocardioides limicola]|uniref:fumarylacetoacetate hydrolase family protein n=1 Tax=Nocardioides limicola TaxID=2803368 RepID=UPI00193B0F88|nr:fumarylacetoacetate hydrolase family protein [Nocardioides sp. DJM-14]
MKAVRFVSPDGSTRLGRLDGEVVTDAGPAPDVGFVPTAQAWSDLAAADGPRHNLGSLRLLAPLRPPKILAIGLNYVSHAEESELEVPPVPVVFAKLPTSVIGPEQDIVIPLEETRPDFEGEVAVVIGRPTYRATVEQAWASVGAVTALHDVSGRRAQLETPLRQFTLGKSFDTFTPLGPCLASADGFDPEKITLRTTVSGEVMQDADTSELIFSIAWLISYLSRGVTLEPGDVIATGTPGGVGDSRVPPRYLVEGDRVDVEVGGVGTLSNPVRHERIASVPVEEGKAR